ncbi:unnamed protein product [Oikopleura dioica]|uniref:Uncharacterized protein n=1 Tax=Oikopleura dioica TaxID=34765 RepID=E4X2D6_OIKDI|nr:unnamed protein product [Oikopleura dioica]
MDDVPRIHDTNVWLHNKGDIWTTVCLNRWRLDNNVQFYIIDGDSWSSGDGRAFNPKVRESASAQWLFAREHLKLCKIVLPDGKQFFALVCKRIRVHELISHITSFLAFAMPRRAFHKKLRFALPQSGPRAAFGIEDLGERELAGYANPVFLSLLNPETEVFWHIAVTEFRPMSIEEKKLDDTKAMMACALAPLFEMKKSGKRMAGAPVKSEFFSEIRGAKLIEVWKSFKSSTKPAGGLARSILSVFDRGDFNVIADRVALAIPVEERRAEDFIREGAALVLRKIRVTSVNSMDELVQTLESCVVDQFEPDDAEDEAREAIATFSKLYDLAPGPEVFWAELHWFIRNVLRIAFRWIREIRTRKIPAVMLRCVDLVEWFRFDCEVPEEPRTPYYESKRYETIGTEGLWYIHKAQPLRFSYIPKEVTSEDQKEHLVHLAMWLAEGTFREELVLKAAKTVEEVVRQGGSVELINNAWQLFLRVVEAQAFQLENKDDFYVLAKAQVRGVDKIVAKNVINFVEKFSRTSPAEAAELWYKNFGLDFCEPRDEDLSKSGWEDIVRYQPVQYNQGPVTGPLFDLDKERGKPDMCLFVGCDGKRLAPFPICGYHSQLLARLTAEEWAHTLTVMVNRIDSQDLDLAKERTPDLRPWVSAAPKTRARLMLEVAQALCPRTRAMAAMPVYVAKLVASRISTGTQVPWGSKIVSDNPKAVKALENIVTNYDNIAEQAEWRTLTDQGKGATLVFGLVEVANHKRTWLPYPVLMAVDGKDEHVCYTERSQRSVELIAELPRHFNLSKIAKDFSRRANNERYKGAMYPEFELILEIQDRFPMLSVAILAPTKLARLAFDQVFLTQTHTVSLRARPRNTEVTIVTKKYIPAGLSVLEKRNARETLTYLHPQPAASEEARWPERPKLYSQQWPALFHTIKDKGDVLGFAAENIFGATRWNPQIPDLEAAKVEEERALGIAALFLEWKKRNGLHRFEIRDLDLSYNGEKSISWVPSAPEFYVMAHFTTSPSKRLAQFTARVRANEPGFVFFSDLDTSVERNLRRDPELARPGVAEAARLTWLAEYPSAEGPEGLESRIDEREFTSVMATRPFALNPQDRHQFPDDLPATEPPIKIATDFRIAHPYRYAKRQYLQEYDASWTPIPSLAGSEEPSVDSDPPQGWNYRDENGSDDEQGPPRPGPELVGGPRGPLVVPNWFMGLPDRVLPAAEAPPVPPTLTVGPTWFANARNLVDNEPATREMQNQIADRFTRRRERLVAQKRPAETKRERFCWRRAHHQGSLQRRQEQDLRRREARSREQGERRAQGRGAEKRQRVNKEKKTEIPVEFLRDRNLLRKPAQAAKSESKRQKKELTRPQAATEPQEPAAPVQKPTQPQTGSGARRAQLARAEPARPQTKGNLSDKEPNLVLKPEDKLRTRWVSGKFMLPDSDSSEDDRPEYDEPALVWEPVNESEQPVSRVKKLGGTSRENASPAELSDQLTAEWEGTGTDNGQEARAFWEAIAAANLGEEPSATFTNKDGGEWVPKKPTTRKLRFEQGTEMEQVREFLPHAGEDVPPEAGPVRSSYAAGLKKLEKRRDEDQMDSAQPQVDKMRKAATKKNFKYKQNRIKWDPHMHRKKKLKKNHVTEHDLVRAELIDGTTFSAEDQQWYFRSALAISARTWRPIEAQQRTEELFERLLQSPAEVTQLLANLAEQYGEINPESIWNAIHRFVSIRKILACKANTRETTRRMALGLPVTITCWAKDFFPGKGEE